MVQPFMIIVVVVMAVLVLFAVCLLVVVMGHPDDKNTAWFPRIVTIFGLWLAFASILILPYDVANSKSSSGGVSVNILWQVAYITLAVMVGAIIPFAFFFYENDVDENDETEGFFNTQIGMALKYTVITLVIFVVIFIIMYSLANKAYVPVLRMAQSKSVIFEGTMSVKAHPNLIVECNALLTGQAADTSSICNSSSFYWIIPVSLPLYIIAFIAFVGWWFFTMFTGVGFFALPLDLINAWRTRPTPISTKSYFEQRAALGTRCKQLLELGEGMQSQFDKAGKGVIARQRDKQDFRAFEKNYFYLKKDYQVLYVAHKLRGGNPLVPIFELILGCISIVISACWFIHIAIFILPAKPYYPFLNNFFIALEEGVPSFPLFGVLAFAIFSFYLLWCVVKGNFRLGVRFLFWKIYPMEVESGQNHKSHCHWLILLISLVY
jgi:LMBR1 domain-containing protein 1